MECGARLVSGCPSCGAANPENAKFCGDCGALLVGGRVDGAPTEEANGGGGRTPATAERRLVTVLFADLVGFTTLAADQDPEDTREFLTRYFELSRDIVERYGGTIEKFIGDAVMAVWGAPTAHEDDAERAVRAALDIVAGVPALGDRFDVQVRAGLLTGEAAVTLGASGQGMVAGDIVNTASRLQSVAPPGAVLVGEPTYRAASGAIAFEQAGEQLLKGKEAPAPAWRAVAVVALRRGSGRREVLEPPFIGRDDELRLLKELFHATERERKARLVSIVGQAGIGKSRLGWEFEKYIDGVVDQVWWHAGRSPAYGDGISYWALAEMVRGRAGIAETDNVEVARGLLRETVAEWVTDEAERRWIEPRLGALLALEPMPPGSRDELFAAWRTFFARIAERGSTVLRFEDIQWADEGMLDFVEDLLDATRSLPLFVITLARPELYDRRSAWGSNLRSFTAMRLEPLEAAQIADMVRGTVPGIAEDALQSIVARAEGVPLYAVETVRMLIDRGVLRPVADGRFEISGELDRLAVPETLHALIAARLDALSEQERRRLQTAAVVGQSFTVEALAGVSGESVEELREGLQALVRRQLLRVEVDPRSPERGQYAFVQAVVKEVAEGSLSRADRRALHLAAARHYESIGDDELVGVLASHYVDAYRATPAGPEADAIGAQARVSLRAAADRATALHSLAQALSYLEQALAVTTEPTEQAALHERASFVAAHLNRTDGAGEHAQAAESIHARNGDRLGVLRAVTMRAFAYLADHAEQPAIALLRPAIDAVGDLPPGRDIVRAHAELARALMLAAEYSESVERCDLVLAAPDVATDEEMIDVLITKGTALQFKPARREAEVLLRGAIETAERLGLISASLRARNNLLSTIQISRQSEVAGFLSDGYDLAIRYGLLTWAMQFAHVALSEAFENGEWEAWIEETGALRPQGFYAGWRVFELGRRQAFRGQTHEAEASLREAHELVGSGSSQAAAALAEGRAAVHVAAGEWALVMPDARIGWIHVDAALLSVAWAVIAGIAAHETAWIAEGIEALDSHHLEGQYPDVFRGFAATGTALLEARWADARANYLVSRRGYEEAGGRFWGAMLDLSVAARGAGHFPEATEAGASAEVFFHSVGADAFVDRYRETIIDAAPALPSSGLRQRDTTVPTRSV